MQITYSHPTTSDAEVLDKINRSCMPENYDVSDWRLILSLNGNISFVAKINNEIVGYCLCLSDNFLYEKCTIVSLAVLKDHRKLSIGTKLLLKCIVAVKNKNKSAIFTLQCRESNENALKLYKHLGFQVTGREVSYYNNPIEDGLILKRTI